MTSPDDTAPADVATRPRYLRRVDVRAAVVVAAVFNAILGVAFLFTGWLVIAIAAQRGFFDQVNSVTSDLSTGHPMQISAVRLCLIWTVVVTLWSITMTVVAGLATLIFNHVLQLLGGVELDLRASPPERVDTEAIARRWAQSIRTKVHALIPRPVLEEGRATSAVRSVNTAAAARTAVASRVDDGPTSRRQEQSLTSR